MTSKGPRVAVVGAGVIGLSCALVLARRGARVVVIDRALDGGLRGARFGVESASSRAAGMLAPYSETLHEPADAAHRDGFALRLAGLRAWRPFMELIDANDIGGPYGGAVLVASTDARAHAISALATKMEHVGARFDWLDRAALDALRAQQKLLCGLVVHDEGQMRPRAALSAIAAAAVSHGVRFREQSVTGCDLAAGGWQMAFDQGESLVVDEVIAAPGAWGDKPLIEVVPMLAHLQPAAGCVIELEGVLLPRTLRADHAYIASGEVARLGGGMTMGRRTNDVDTALQDVLLHEAQQLIGHWIPGGRTVRDCVRAVGAGVRAMSPDWAPLIGRAHDTQVLVGAGHGRNGWLLAPLTAEIVTAHVFDDPIPPLWAAFTPNRFDEDAP